MSTWNRRIATGALLLLVPTLAACGFGEQSDQIYQPGVGTNSRTGQIWVLNSVIVSEKQGQGVFAGTLVNENTGQADKLVSVTDAKTPEVTIPAGGLVNLANTGQVQITDPSISAGDFVTLTFQFASGQSVTLRTPVVANTGDFAKVPMTPAPTPGSSTTKKPAKGAKSGSTGSSTPSSPASPSATPTP